MSSWRLTLKQTPTLRLDLRGITPSALAALSQAQVALLPIGCGNRQQPLADWFSVKSTTTTIATATASTATTAEPMLHLEGDLSRCDRVGWQMDAGHLIVDSAVGHYAGAGMRGGVLHVHGDADLQAACEMAGGAMTVDGNVGDFAASTLPGSMDGMRGGSLIVKGHAGARFADRMRRGTAVVCGDAGDFVASRLVAGTVVVGGRCGAHVAYGMRRGSVVFAGPSPTLPATFVAAQANADVMWQLLARDLARQLTPHDTRFADLPGRRTHRALGDLAVAGTGELIFLN
jgi:formylmethanofuran dehydrogenase subunit C